MRPETCPEADRLEAWAYALIEQLRAYGINLPPAHLIEFHALRTAEPQALMHSAQMIAALTVRSRTIH
jgi:hypothetical protein